METMRVELSEETMERLGDIIANKIMFAKNSPEPWIDIQELSEKVGRSVGTLHHDVERNNLPCIRGGRRLRFKLSEVERWLVSRRKG